MDKKELYNYFNDLATDISNDSDLRQEIAIENTPIRVKDIKSSLNFLEEKGLDSTEVFNLAYRLVNVEDIPVEIDLDNEESRLDLRCEYVSPLYNKIVLGNSDKDIVNASYLHKVMHTQVNDFYHVKQVRKTYNIELLPIFIELLYSKEVTKSPKVLYKRLFELKNQLYNYSSYYLNDKNISKEELEECKKQIYSTLQAINLLDKYSNGDEDYKNKMMYYIEEIIMCHTYLEKVLKKFNVNIYNSTYDYKTLKKMI